MPASLQHIHPGTPMGANARRRRRDLSRLGAARSSGSRARRLQRPPAERCEPADARRAGPLARVHPGARDRQRYMFYVVGDGSEGPKRDPYARELQAPFPSECIIRSSDFPWHDCGYVTPAFHDFVIYQLHVGTFFTPNLPAKGGTFLDVARKIPYLAELGRDGDSADADSGISDRVQSRLQRHRLLLARNGFRGRGRRPGAVCRGSQPAARRQGAAALSSRRSPRRDEPAEGARRSRLIFTGSPSCSISSTTMREGTSATRACISSIGSRQTAGIAILCTSPTRDTRAGWCSTSESRKCATFSFRTRSSFSTSTASTASGYDQVSVIDHDGAPHGWSFCQDLTSTLRAHRPGSFDKAEYWSVNPYDREIAAGGSGVRHVVDRRPAHRDSPRHRRMPALQTSGRST